MGFGYVQTKKHAWNLGGSKHLENALADFDSAIELDPQYLAAYIQQAWIYFRMGDYALAVCNCRDVQAFIDTDSTLTVADSIRNNLSFCSNYLLGIINALSGLEHYQFPPFRWRI